MFCTFYSHHWCSDSRITLGELRRGHSRRAGGTGVYLAQPCRVLCPWAQGNKELGAGETPCSHCLQACCCSNQDRFGLTRAISKGHSLNESPPLGKLPSPGLAAGGQGISTQLLWVQCPAYSGHLTMLFLLCVFLPQEHLRVRIDHGQLAPLSQLTKVCRHPPLRKGFWVCSDGWWGGRSFSEATGRSSSNVGP